MSLLYKEQLYRVIVLALAFMMIFIAFGPLQNIITKLFAEIGYQYFGEFSLLVSYSFFTISTAYSAAIIHKHGYKVVLIACAIAHCLFNAQGLIVFWLGQNIYFAVFIVTLISAILGVASGCIWVCQVSYIANVTDVANRNEMFGLFWGIKSFSSIVGYLLSGIVLTEYGIQSYFTILIPIGTLSIAIFFVLPHSEVANEQIEKDKEEPSNFSGKVNQYYQILSIKQNIDLYCYLAVPGVMKAIASVFNYIILLNSIEKGSQQTEKQFFHRQTYLSSIFFLIYGISQTISGFLVKIIANYYSCYQMAEVGTVFCIISTLVSFISYQFNNYLLACLSSLLWGFSLTFNRSNSNTLASIVFSNDIFLLRISYFIFAATTMISILLILIVRVISINLLLLVFFVIFSAILKISKNFYQIARINESIMSQKIQKIANQVKKCRKMSHQFDNPEISLRKSFLSERPQKIQMKTLNC